MNTKNSMTQALQSNSTIFAVKKRLEWWKNSVSCLIFLIVVSCTQPNTITGYIEGLSNDTILVEVTSLDRIDDGTVQDTIFAENGQFKYTFPDSGAHGLFFSFPQFFVRNRPSGGLYIPGNSHLIVFTEQGNKIRLKGKVNSSGLSNITVSGSKLNSDFSSIQNKMFEINIDAVKEEMAFEQAMEDRNKEAEKIGWANRQKRLNARRELYSNYIRTNIDNPLSIYLLCWQPLDSMEIYNDKIEAIASNSIFRHVFDDHVKLYQEYKSAMKAKEEVIIGNKAPDFTLEDVTGKPFMLSSLRGKYVIIDFWGSWCGPCIAGIPKMKSIYEKNKNKFEILGVACREESIDIWRNAVKQYELPWKNVYDDNLSAVNVKYGIESYPTKIVIDPEGTILIRELGEGDDFYTKLESVIK